MYIGIDLGSSFIKFAHLEDDGRITKKRQYPTQRIAVTDRCRAEFAMAPILDAVRAYIGETLADGLRPSGILISTQMHGFILRQANGAESHYISWQDELSLVGGAESDFAYLSASIGGYMRGSGLRLKPELALCSLYARLRRGELAAEGAELFTLGSYLISALCGVNCTHLTNAAPTGLYTLRDAAPNAPLLAAVGLEALRLPQVARECKPVGEYCGIPVYPDVGDQQASLLGAGLEMGQISINLGTASQVALRTAGYTEVAPEGIDEIRPFFFGDYLHTVSKLSGGRNLQVLVDFLRASAEFAGGAPMADDALWDKIEQLSPIDTAGLSVSTGFFSSQLFPGGQIDGIDQHNLTPEGLLCAAFVDLAARFLRVIAGIDPRHEANAIRLSGGRLCKILRHFLMTNPNNTYSILLSCSGDAVFHGLRMMLQEPPRSR